MQGCIDAGLTWVQGLKYFFAFANSNATCAKGFCFYSDPRGPDFTADPDDCVRFSCSSCVLGTEPQCTDQQLCESTSYCDQILGCRLVEGFAPLTGVRQSYVWTPRGDILTYVEERNCQKTSPPPYGPYVLSWEPPLQTEQQCHDWGGVCIDGTVPNITAPVPIVVGPPAGMNRRNKTECEKCGGKYVPWWQWKKGEWRVIRTAYQGTGVSPNRLIAVQDIKQATKPQWVRTTTQSLPKWNLLVDAARALRLGTIYTNSFLCKKGTSKTLLNLVSCSCAGPDSEEEVSNSCSALFQGNYPVGLVSLCPGITQVQRVLSAALDPSNLQIDNKTSSISQCVQVRVGYLPYDLLASHERRVISSSHHFGNLRRSTQVHSHLQRL